MTFYTNRAVTSRHSGGRTPAYPTAHGSYKTRRESVADFISVVDYVATPVMNEFEKVPEDSDVYEWIMDSFENPADSMGTAPDDIFSAMEDEEIDPTPPDSRTRIANVSHQLYTDYALTNWQRKTTEIGVGDPLAYHKFKSFIHLNRMFEYVMLFSQINAGSYANTTEEQMSNKQRLHGLFGWGISTGENPAGDVTLADRLIPAEYSSTYWNGPTGGTDMSSDEFYDNMLEPYVLRGGDVNALTFFTSFKAKRVMSGWTMVYQSGGNAHPANDRNIGADENRLNLHVDIFDTDYGRVEVQPCRIMSNSPTRTGYGAAANVTLDPRRALVGIDASYADMTVQEEFYSMRLARTGPQVREVLWGHMGFRMHNPKALIVGLNVAA